MTDEELLEALAALQAGAGVVLRTGHPPDEVLRRRDAAAVFARSWRAILDRLTPAQRARPWPDLVGELDPATRQAIVDILVLASHEVALPLDDAD